MSARVSAPVGIAVRGRPGVGAATVADALRAAGMVVSDAGEVVVLVIAEVCKPEDLALLAELRRAGVPGLIVFNKADLAGSGPGGPMATAQRRAVELRALTGVPVVPMVALLAAVTLPAELISALRTLAVQPADLTSADAFVAGEHPVPHALRARLLATLDRFGVAHASLALSRGAEADELPALLRRLSGVEDVLAALRDVAAPVRYRRVRAALAELRALGRDDVARFLAADDTVIAVMAAAVDVVQAHGLVVDPGTRPEAHVRRARHWRNYGRGPVDALHRSCSADIVRGSLRLLGGR
ncbi:hypothetical protein [Mycobacterium aquaticum]|uniref:Uncharacterized protein n=1 Tax=Mycobacterium aquaticum TaxID=1927124 RepID=A0A1X0AX03_9MYCO|nr:hypothetical protein [Mycobacterium aquaticum]ORA34435.1 hypothetical protein BST13_16925 [Mycobacterium aquaticum]